MALVIRRSSIHGDGVYTTVPIAKRKLIVEYTGPRLSNEAADAIYDQSPRTYLFGLLDGEHVIDGDGIAAFINHSCDPNCEADEIKGRVIIRAIRHIKAGDELAYDYNLYDGDLDDAAACHCKTRRCRGSMYSEKELGKRKRF
jgi:SET domain-containing protein